MFRKIHINLFSREIPGVLVENEAFLAISDGYNVS